MRAAVAALVLVAACGPPSYVETREDVDDYLSRGNYAYACVALKSDEHVRTYAAEQLAKYPNEAAASDCLCAAVYDAGAHTWDPVVAQGLFGSRHEAASTCLANAVADTGVKDRLLAIKALGGTMADVAWPALEAVARHDGSVEMRLAAIEALAPSTEHTEFLTLILSSDPNVDLRVAATKALGAHEGDVARKALMKAAREDAEVVVRSAALSALGKPTKSDTIRVVCDALMGDADPGVRAAAATTFAGTTKGPAASCLAKKLAEGDDDGSVREALLEAAKTSPKEVVSKALCDNIGPWVRRYVKGKIQPDIPGTDIVDAQNTNHWEASFECVSKAHKAGGYSCYGRNYLAHWVNELGGRATPPWCPGMIKTGE